MFSSAVRLHLLVQYMLDAGALLANMILVALIVLRTLRCMPSYSILLLNNAIIDAVSTVASGLLINRPDDSQVCVFLGLCAVRGPWFSLHIFLSCHSTVIAFHSFCFRLYILRRKNMVTELPAAGTTALISIALYLPTCVAVVVFYSVFEDTRSALLMELRLELYTTTYARFIVPVAFVIISSPIVSSVNVVIRRNLLQQILMMDTAKRHEHSRIARALTYQLLLPFGMVLGSAAWIADAIGVWTSELSQRLPLILCSVIALVSPPFNLVFLPPYRSFFQRPPRPGPSTQ